jgi:serine/threonine protein kinase
MHETGRCPKCATDLSADAPEGLCPACLFRQALDDSDAEQGVNPQSNSPAPAFVPPAPADLARYFPQLEIMELLGQGGMGAVYKARQTKLDRLIAVKVLPPEVARDPAFAERFMREARSLARLNHPNIVTIYDFGETNGLFYFSMEFVDGQNARQLMHAGKLPQAQTLSIVSQVCDALRYAHDEGIVHRDIKPENILLDKRGRVKIADFGLAKLVGLTPTYLTLTGAHEVMGTLYYMAPEQTRRSHQVDHRADIYSLGVVFYEMLTGELPLGRFAPPAHKAAVDGRLDAIVLRALAREPEHRYQDAGDLKQEIEAIAGGQQTVAPPHPPAAPPPNWPSVRFHIPRSSRKGKKYHGAIYGDDNELVVEYEEEENPENSEILVKRIPLSGIDSLGVHWNWEQGYQELVIKPSRLSVLSGLPTGKSGRGHLRIDMTERRAAQKLVNAVSQRISPKAQTFATPEATKIAIVMPAIGLLITGVFAFLGNTALILILNRKMMIGDNHDLNPTFLISGMLPILISFVGAGFLVKGAVRMLQQRAYGMVVAATFLAMIPWSVAWPISLPMGIMALIVLRKRPVIELFFPGPNRPEPQQTRSFQASSSRGVLGFFRSVRGYFLTAGPAIRSNEAHWSGGPENVPGASEMDGRS